MLLLSQCFDDTALKRHFQPPEGTEFLGFTNSADEVSAILLLMISFRHATKRVCRVSLKVFFYIVRLGFSSENGSKRQV